MCHWHFASLMYDFFDFFKFVVQGGFGLVNAASHLLHPLFLALEDPRYDLKISLNILHFICFPEKLLKYIDVLQDQSRSVEVDDLWTGFRGRLCCLGSSSPLRWAQCELHLGSREARRI